ncbi:MAG: hypothetical protein QXO70_01395 [Candidatus Pacearchaeota archaeon]
MVKVFSYLVIVFSFMIILPNVSGISVDIKQNYKPRETLIAKIEGNFIEPIKPENILFYSGRIATPMFYEVGKLDEKTFYLYAILPNKERNYTLIIKNVHYFEAGSEKKQNLEFNFSVSGPVADFTVTPGFVVSAKDFVIKAESNTDNLELPITYKNFSGFLEVPAGSSNTITIPLIFDPKIVFLEIKSSNTTYKIPVKSMAEVVKRRAISFSKTFSNITIYKGSPYKMQVYLSNDGDEELKNINISSNIEIEINPKIIPALKPHSFSEINLTLMPDEEGNIIIYANVEELSANTTIQVKLIKIEVGNLTEERKQEIKRTFSCPEIGKICKENQKCIGQEISTLETPKCCIGECKTPTSFLTVFLIFLILAIIGGVAYAVYYFLKLKKKKILPPILKESAGGKLIEVHKSLSKT